MSSQPVATDTRDTRMGSRLRTTRSGIWNNSDSIKSSGISTPDEAGFVWIDKQNGHVTYTKAITPI